ncbi:MAG: peptidylprolyl isomerase [Reichenbachiella sp.]
MSINKITGRRPIGRLFYEPLVQFLLIGFSLYMLYGLFGFTEDSTDENTLVVTSGELAWMKDTWTKRWNRPPTERELEGLINQHVEEAILYREAVKMGLDNDDVIIKRRMAQKLRFLQEDLMKPVEPSDEELQSYFEEKKAAYTSAPLLTLTQIFFDPDLREDATLPDAEKTKAQLMKMDIKSINPNKYGDRFMLQSYFPNRTEAEIAKLFGSEFAVTVAGLSSEQWHGPVLSGYGTHLVYIDSIAEPEPPQFETVKTTVMEDWKVNKQKELNELFIESVLSRYTITIEGIEGAETPADDVKEPEG